MKISFIVATTGRVTLQRTLASIQPEPQDEILLVGFVSQMPQFPQIRYFPTARGGDWGATERNFALQHALGDMVSFMDDDDVYVPGARVLLASAPLTAPSIFRMQYANGHTLWRERFAVIGNIGTPMLFLPNDRFKLGQFGHRYEGDFDFWQSCRWAASDIVWREEVLALIRP